MLNEIKLNYERYADTYVPGWRDVDKNEMCINYSNSDDKAYKDKLCPAIIVKFWDVFDRFSYNHQFGNVLSTDTIYDMYIDSLMYVLKKAVWNDSTSSVYNDAHAPERCLIMRMKHQRLNKIRDIGRYKELANLKPVSLDSLVDEFGDFAGDALQPVDRDSDILCNDVTYLVVYCIEHKQYLTAIVIYILSTSHVSGGDERLARFLFKQLHTMNNKFCEEFAEMFSLSYEFVKSIVEPFVNMSPHELNTKVNRLLPQLKNRTQIRELLNAY